MNNPGFPSERTYELRNLVADEVQAIIGVEPHSAGGGCKFCDLNWWPNHPDREDWDYPRGGRTSIEVRITSSIEDYLTNITVWTTWHDHTLSEPEFQDVTPKRKFHDPKQAAAYIAALWDQERRLLSPPQNTADAEYTLNNIAYAVGKASAKYGDLPVAEFWARLTHALDEKQQISPKQQENA